MQAKTFEPSRRMLSRYEQLARSMAAYSEHHFIEAGQRLERMDFALDRVRELAKETPTTRQEAGRRWEEAFGDPKMRSLVTPGTRGLPRQVAQCGADYREPTRNRRAYRGVLLQRLPPPNGPSRRRSQGFRDSRRPAFATFDAISLSIPRERIRRLSRPGMHSAPRSAQSSSTSVDLAPSTSSLTKACT